MPFYILDQTTNRVLRGGYYVNTPNYDIGTETILETNKMPIGIIELGSEYWNESTGEFWQTAP